MEEARQVMKASREDDRAGADNRTRFRLHQTLQTVAGRHFQPGPGRHGDGRLIDGAIQL